MTTNNGFLRCTVCGATFDVLEKMCCPECGTNDNYIVQNELEIAEDNEDDVF